MTFCKTQLSTNVWRLHDQLKNADYYDLYIGGGALFLDTGDGHVRLALGSREMFCISSQRPLGRWVWVELNVTECDPRLKFPLDYFLDSMADEFKQLRRELYACLDERIEELYDQTVFGPD